MQDNYEVGYKKPPKNTQFKKGQSGNPEGRPKGSKNERKPFMNDDFTQIILNELNDTVEINKGGEAVSLSKLEIMMFQLSKLAASGNLKAINKCMNLAQSIAERDNKEYSMVLRHELELLNKKRENMALSAGCSLYKAKQNRIWKLHEKVSERAAIRKVFGEEKISYVEAEPRTPEDWARWDKHLEDELAGKGFGFD